MRAALPLLLVAGLAACDMAGRGDGDGDPDGDGIRQVGGATLVSDTEGATLVIDANGCQAIIPAIGGPPEAVRDASGAPVCLGPEG